MGDSTKIEWCDKTFNGWQGCTKVGPGCDHCYAETRNLRFHKGVNWGAGAPRRRTSEANWKKPLQWNKQSFYECIECGDRFSECENLNCPTCNSISVVNARPRVFCASLADVFDNEVDPQWRADLFRLIYNTPNLDWLLLTKRIGNAESMINQVLMDARRGTIGYLSWPWPNVWLGATIVNQEEADRDIMKLINIPAKVHFLSMEPLLGPVNLPFPPGALGPENFPDGMDSWSQKRRDDWFEMQARATYISRTMLVDWVIAGGESGRGARAMQPDWVRSLRDQCKEYSVPFLLKQWGEFAPNWLNDIGGNKIPDSEWMDRMGKKLAGRKLDGEIHTEFPA